MSTVIAVEINVSVFYYSDASQVTKNKLINDSDCFNA